MANDTLVPNKSAEGNHRGEEAIDEEKFLAFLEKKGLRATAEVYRNELRGTSNSSSTSGASGKRFFISKQGPREFKKPAGAKTEVSQKLSLNSILFHFIAFSTHNF